MNHLRQFLMALLLIIGQASVLEPATGRTGASSEAVHAMLPCHSESRSHKLPLPHMCCSSSLAFTVAAEMHMPGCMKLETVEPSQIAAPLTGMILPPRAPPPRA